MALPQQELEESDGSRACCRERDLVPDGDEGGEGACLSLDMCFRGRLEHLRVHGEKA